MVADPQLKKRVAEKRLIFTGQKISLLALHTASLELDSRLPVKSLLFVTRHAIYRWSVSHTKQYAR